MPKSQITYPRSRQRDLLVEQVGDETIVYDQTRKQAHSLNPMAAAVWRNCDGASSVEQVAERIGPEADETVVQYALDRLAEAHLVDHGASESAPRVSRRAMLRRFAAAGAAAVAIPLVLTIAAPTPAMAQSAGGGGGVVDPPVDPPIDPPVDPGDDF